MNPTEEQQRVEEQLRLRLKNKALAEHVYKTFPNVPEVIIKMLGGLLNGRGKYSDIVYILEYCTAIEEKKHVSMESWRGA